MKDEGEIYIDPANTPRLNAQNLETLRGVRRRYMEKARDEANADIALELLERAWTLDEVVRQGEEMTRALDEEQARAGDYVELFSGRFYEVRPDGWGPNPLRVHDLRRHSIASTFATPEAANGYARERESESIEVRRRLDATVLLGAAGLLVAVALLVGRWLL